MKKLIGICGIIFAATFLAGCVTSGNGSGSITARTSKHGAENPGRSYGMTTTNKIVRAGQLAQRFEIRHGDCGRSRHWNDCTTDRQRIERKENPKNTIQKIGQQVWYGWSLYLPPDFQHLGRSGTTLGQVKLNHWRTPIWSFGIREGRFRVAYPWHKECKIAAADSLRGRWNDIVIFVDYSYAPKGKSFVLYLNGQQVCSITRPLIQKHMVRVTDQRLFMKYGIYNSYISRWLNANKTKFVNPQTFKDAYDRGANSSKSPTNTPFKFDWGVKLPTHIVYYDEMRYGKSRDEVDILRLEKLGAKPVD